MLEKPENNKLRHLQAQSSSHRAETQSFYGIVPILPVNGAEKLQGFFFSLPLLFAVSAEPFFFFFKSNQSYFHLFLWRRGTFPQRHKEAAATLWLATQDSAGVSTPEQVLPSFIPLPYRPLINAPSGASRKSHQCVCPDVAPRLFSGCRE